MNNKVLIETLYETMADFKRLMVRSRDKLLGELQLTKTQIEVVMLLSENDGQTVGDLATQLGVTNSASTQTIETLVRRDLVERTADSVDRRVVRAQLSPSGRELARRLHASRIERLNQVFAGLTTDELNVIITVLKRLTLQFETKPTQEVN